MKKYMFLLITSYVILCTFTPLSGQKKTSENQLPMYMLSYDHGGLILWGSEHFSERLKDAASWLDKYPEFKIGLDNEAHMYDYLAEHDIEVLQEIQSMQIKYPGRFGIGTCTYGQPLSQFINEESNIRQIGYALQTNLKYFSTTPDVYLMSEHAMHSQIPQILVGFGFKGAIMRTHFMMYGYNPTYNEPFGWWIGMDGSRIPTVPTYDGEGAEFFKTPVDNWILTRYPSKDATMSLQDFREQFAHINPLLASRADDSGLRKEELVREYNGNPLFKWILLDELLELYPNPKAEFVTRPDDFKVRMPWGYCGNKIWNTSRKAEVSVLTAERLAALEFLNDGIDRENTLHQSWKNLLVAQHHDIQIVGLTNDAEKYLSASLEASESVIKESLQWAAEHMSSDGVQQVTVFNPLSWERNEWIETKVSFEKGQALTVNVSLGETKVPVTYLQTHRFSDGSIFEAKIAFEATLPPLSLSSYSVTPDSDQPESFQSGLLVDREELSISTPYYHVQLNAGGGISSITDLESNSQIFNPEHRSAYFTGIIDGREVESSGRWILSKTDTSSPWITATEYGFIADIPYTLSVKFYANTPRIDCAADFHFDQQKIGQLSDNERDRDSPFMHDKKLRFKCFPALTGLVSGIKDLPFMVTETDNMNVEGNYWTAIANNQKGLAYFNKGNMGSVREDDGGFSIPLSYAMYYIWGTRMLEGVYSYDFSMFPFSSPWQQANLHREAIAYNYPVIYSSSKPGDKSLGNTIELLDIQSEHVLLSAFYVQDKNIILRMYESAGKKEVISHVVKDKKFQLTPSDLKGVVIGPPSEKIQFTPWQIRTFLLQQ